MKSIRNTNENVRKVKNRSLRINRQPTSHQSPGHSIEADWPRIEQINPACRKDNCKLQNGQRKSSMTSSMDGLTNRAISSGRLFSRLFVEELTGVFKVFFRFGGLLCNNSTIESSRRAIFLQLKDARDNASM